MSIYESLAVRYFSRAVCCRSGSVAGAVTNYVENIFSTQAKLQH